MPKGIYPRTKEHRRNMSLAQIGNKNGLGYKHTKRELEKMSKTHLNITKETREKMRIAQLGNKNRLGKHQGDKVGKKAYHNWVKSHKPKPKLCEFCHKKKDRLGHTKLELANLKNHQYSRNLNEWKYGHRSCHRELDYPDGMMWGNLHKKKSLLS